MWQHAFALSVVGILFLLAFLFRQIGERIRLERELELTNATLVSLEGSYQEAKEDASRTTDELIAANDRIAALQQFPEENAKLRKLLEEISSLTINYQIPF